MAENLSFKDIEVREVVRNMAEILKTDCVEDGPELCVQIPEKLGSGSIRAFNLEHGLGVLDVDCMLTEPVSFTLDNRQIQPLKIIFNRDSEIVHSFEGTDEQHQIARLESAMTSCNMKHGHSFTFPGGRPICLFSLEINRKLFEAKITDFLAEMNGELEDVLRDVNGVNLFFYKGYYSLDIARYIEEFLTSELDGFMHAVYLEGKAYEILSHYLQQYLDDQNRPEERHILRQSTVERIQNAVEIIREELDQHIGIPELARRAGLNKNTLQQGFKVLHKMSVNDFIRHERIVKAKELLETTDLNVTEVTYKIGINSRSYFSKLFKEKYGMSPKQYVSQRRGDSSEPSD